MRKSWILVAIFILVSGCSFQSDYDKYMDEAKELVIAQDYNKAISTIEMALVEEPTDKDAAALLKSTKEKKERKDQSDRLEWFIKLSTPVRDKAVELYSTFDVETITVADAEEKLPSVKALLPALQELDKEILDIDELSDSFTHLNYMVTGLQKAYEAIIENISDPVGAWDRENESRKDRLTKLSESKDSRTRARGELLFFDTEEEKFNELQSVFEKKLHDLKD